MFIRDQIELGYNGSYWSMDPEFLAACGFYDASVSTDDFVLYSIGA